MPEQKQIIVVVDDDAGMSQAIERLLNAAGYDTRTFDSAEALLADGKAPAAACLVLDVNLPGLSGFELSRRMAESGMRQPIIFITAHDEAVARQKAEQAGAFAFFAKPFSGRSLIAAVATALGGVAPTG